MGSRKRNVEPTHIESPAPHRFQFSIPISITLGEPTTAPHIIAASVHAVGGQPVPGAPLVPTSDITPRPARRKKDNEWHTPTPLVDRVRDFFGGVIELDPASCAEANRTVGATRFFTQRDNGLKKPWKAPTVFLNPPYRTEDGPLESWLQKAIKEVRRGTAKQIVALMPAITDSKWFQIAQQHSMCILREKLKFRRPGERKGSTIMWGHVLLYIGPHERRFARAFADLGAIHAARRKPSR